MCGRFTLTHPNEAMAALFAAAPANDLPPVPRFNICPTQDVAVVTSEAGFRRLRPMRWGFVPHWYKAPNDGPLILNARADTIATKPAFREAVRQRRCILPASGFFEWSAGPSGERLPWHITRSDSAPLAFAAIWQIWQAEGNALASCAIVTTEAGPDMTRIHHREPVVLSPSDWPLWLGEAGHGAALLMKPGKAGNLSAFRVGTAVNSSRASGPALIAPLPA